VSHKKDPVSTPESPEVSQVQDFWEAHPLSAYESPFQPGTKEFFHWHDQVRLTDVEPYSMHLYEFDRHAGERVLDVGCGIGWLCRHFAAGGANITGVDLTRRGVELTRKRLDGAGLKGTVIQASAEDLPFKTDSFDFVTSAGVLHHTPETRRGGQGNPPCITPRWPRYD
jgi:2-polyprenyl-3-methyl-5-hydroxy-6-metoxy-1,4-benzoquinol methylase